MWQAKFVQKVLVLSAFLMGGAAQAALDPAVTNAISSARLDALTLVGVLTAMVAAIWGALYLRRLLLR